MTTGFNFGKQAGNIFRNRLATVQELAEVYKPAIKSRGKELLEILKEKAEVASRSKVAGKMRVLKEYYKVEMAPPSSMNEIAKLQMDLAIVKEFVSSGAYKHLTVKQAWLLFLVAVEVGMWFFLGETVGKMHFVGYKV